MMMIPYFVFRYHKKYQLNVPRKIIPIQIVTEKIHFLYIHVPEKVYCLQQQQQTKLCENVLPILIVFLYTFLSYLHNCNDSLVILMAFFCNCCCCIVVRPTNWKKAWQNLLRTKVALIPHSFISFLWLV